MSYELINNSGKDQQVELALARAKLLQKDHIAAELHITQALSIDYENVEAWALWGHVKYLQADYDAAKGLQKLIFLRIEDFLFFKVDTNERCSFTKNRRIFTHFTFDLDEFSSWRKTSVERNSFLGKFFGFFSVRRSERHVFTRLSFSTDLHNLFGSRHSMLPSNFRRFSVP